MRCQPIAICSKVWSIGDEETWGWHLLDVMAQGFEPKYTIADGGSGLRAGQNAVMPAIPCYGNVLHIQR